MVGRGSPGYWIMIVAVVVLGVTGCYIDPNDGPGAAGAPGLVSPADADALPYPGMRLGPQAPAFYTAPAPGPDAKPGDLIWARPVAAPRGSRGFGILYWSTTDDGALVAVSGVLLEPENASPGTGRRIVGGGHGASGLGDQCAPSMGYFDGTGSVTPFVDDILGRGMVYVESDYQGLGTPGEHPFIVARSAARNVLDSVRAAAQLTGAGQNVDSVLVGHSQGGGAVLMAAELQPQYAPELRLRGTVGVAPPSQMEQLDDQLAGGEYAGYLLMSLHGLLTAYPALDADTRGLTDAGRTALAEISNQCTGEILSEYRGSGEAKFGLDRVFDAPDFAAALARSDPGRQPLRVPALVVHGERDDTIPVQNSRELVKRYCAEGAAVTARFVPGAGHVDVFWVALPEIENYVLERLAGAPAPTRCG